MFRLVLFVSLLIFVPPALAAKRTPADELRIARKHLDEARKAYMRGHWQRAAEQWIFAYNFRHEPVLRFDIAQAYRQDGQWARAKVEYEAYLQAKPNAPNAAEVKQRLSEMTANVAARRPAVRAVVVPSRKRTSGPPSVQ